MENPFIFGDVVTGKYFADREREFEELISDLESGQNIVMYSPRRYGKTSLILKVLRSLEEKGILTAYLDLFEVTSKVKFTEKFASVVIPRGKLDEVIELVKEALPKISPKLTLGTEPSIELDLGLSKKDAGRVFEDILDLSQRIAKKKGKRMVVVFDEFQEIGKLDGEEIENIMRSRFQHHDMVSYVFMGSKKHLFDTIFGNKNRPFFRFGKQFLLDKLPKEEYAEFIGERFLDKGVKIKQDLMDKILEITECHPYYTQQLCHELWNLCEESITKEDIDNAIKNVLRNQSYAYELIWDSLRGHVKSLLLGIAIDKGNIYSSEFISKHGLNSPTYVQKAVKTLEKKQLIEKKGDEYVIEDIFFTEWLRKRLTTN